ncbi:hypothetical protein CCR75_004465 [Bremia lactucae]|uniref:PLAC8 motif-containing protein n=1 Tax=Bremia lactucae TaxID=4779 RepID=A0A976IHS0_BRELC|nr:hypothetical protein CCR75_004465 [Bremia lactucae]
MMKRCRLKKVFHPKWMNFAEHSSKVATNNLLLYKMIEPLSHSSVFNGDDSYVIQVDSPVVSSRSHEFLHKGNAYPHAVQLNTPVTPIGGYNGSKKSHDDAIKTEGWETALCFGCFKHCVPNCCMVTFCPCVTQAQVSTRLGMAPYWFALVTLFILVLLTGGTVHLILFVWVWKARALTRERFQIPGGCFRDCCASLFCPCCTLAQIATHIKSYQPGSCDFGPPDTLPPYSRT